MLLPRLDQVADDRDRAEDRAADAAGQADHLAGAVANCRDAMQRARDASAVILAEHADAVDHIVDIVLRNLVIAQEPLMATIARFGQPAQIHNNFEQIFIIVGARFRATAGCAAGSVYKQEIYITRDVALF